LKLEEKMLENSNMWEIYCSGTEVLQSLAQKSEKVLKNQIFLEIKFFFFCMHGEMKIQICWRKKIQTIEIRISCGEIKYAG